MENVINFDLLKEYDGTLKEVLKVWQKEKSYSVDDTIQYKGNYLKCTTAGTSGTTTLDFTGVEVGDTITDGTVVWEVIEPPSGKGIDFYTVGESYDIGDIVIYNGSIYQCITAHTATFTFDNTKWEEISKSGIPYYNQDTYYKVDDQVVYNNKIYKCVTAHTSTSTFDSTKWEELSSGGGISIWQANTDYEVNDVVIDSNLIWQCATAHTSTTTFDESKWICISGGEISNGYEIVPLWEGIGNTLNQVLTLSDNYTNYEYILGTMADGAGLVFASNILYTASNYGLYIMGVLSNGGVKRAYLQFSSNQATILEATGLDSSKYISKLQGIRKAKPIVSSGMKYETLWEGEAGSLSGSGSTTINLSEPVSKYQKIGFTIKTKPGNESTLYYREIDVDTYIKFIDGTLSTDHIGFYEGFGSHTDYIELNSGSTSTQLSVAYGNSYIVKITGISEGVVVPTGVQAARVTLWEGQYNTVNNSTTSFTDTVQLSTSILDFNQIEITVNAYSITNSEDNFYTEIFNISDIVYGQASIRTSTTSGNTTCSFLCGFKDSTHFGICFRDGSGWSDAKITKIVGIKYIQPDSYSTDEKLIGTWIDGKPLYRKVFTPTGSGENYTFSTGLTSNNYNVCRIYAYIFDSSGDFLSIPFYNGYSRYSIYITPSTGYVKIGSNNATYNIDSVVIEYTKN